MLVYKSRFEPCVVYCRVCRMQGLLVASAALPRQLELLLSRRTLLFRTLSVPLDLGAGHAPLGLKLRRRPVCPSARLRLKRVGEQQTCDLCC